VAGIRGRGQYPSLLQQDTTVADDSAGVIQHARSLLREVRLRLLREWLRVQRLPIRPPTPTQAKGKSLTASLLQPLDTNYAALT
jgi:hypothetical protein